MYDGINRRSIPHDRLDIFLNFLLTTKRFVVVLHLKRETRIPSLPLDKGNRLRIAQLQTDFTVENNTVLAEEDFVAN